MRAGMLRHKVIIQQNTPTRDAHGAALDAWTTFATTWASFEPLRGREYFQAHEVNAEATIRIRMRYVAGVLPKMRITEGARVFNIVSVGDVLGRGKELEIIATEVV